MKFKKCGPEHEHLICLKLIKIGCGAEMIFQNYWSLFAKKPTSKDSGEARKKPVMDSGIRIARKKFREDEETDKIIEHEHFWTAHDEWAQYIGKPHRIWRRLHTGVMRMEKMPLTA